MGSSEKEENHEKRSSRSSSIVSQMVEVVEKKSFPFCIFFILGNEFCERYSYYGMRTILVLYLRSYLDWDENTSTAIYHAFTVLAYLFPLIGAMIADSWWGKYRTILYLSIVYAIGMIVITMGAISPLGDLTVHIILSCVGLFVIAFGTGGIKPCVSAFGGDQFDADQENQRRSFFSLFYFAINAGSLLSTFVTPLIRDRVKCFGEDEDCYALAFGIPAALMVVAIFFFILGTKWYRRFPPQGNIFLQVSKTVFRAWKVRWNTPKKERNKEHWLDYADNGSNATMIRDIKYVLNVLVLFIPLPLFWALFDQQGSRWTLMAIRMDGQVGSIYILPDQMQICNPLLIVTMIPLFEVTLYPCLRKFNINFSPLRKMTLGMILAGVSFVVAAIIQMDIDVSLTPTPYNGQQTSLRIINAADCDIGIVSDVYQDWIDEENTEGSTFPVVLMPGNDTGNPKSFIKPGEYKITYQCVGSEGSEGETTVNLAGNKVYDLVISRSEDRSLYSYQTAHPTEKSDSGRSSVGMINVLSKNITCKYQYEGKQNIIVVPPNQRVEIGSFGGKARYDITLEYDEEIYQRSFQVSTGGLYTLIVRDSDGDGSITGDNDLIMDQYIDINPNDVNIFWLIPQYFIITLGEVFLSVTGLEFAYTQAPPSMKSVLTSFWLFTVSIGNIIVLIVAEARLIPKQVDEYFLFAGLIGVAAILFIILAIRYEYVDESEFAEDGKEDDEDSEFDSDSYTKSSITKTDIGKINKAFLHNTEL